MWKLPLPSISELDEQLTRALTYANETPIYAISSAERAAVFAVYAAYDSLLGQPDPQLLPPELIACRPFIRAGYDQVRTGGRLQKLRDKLLISADLCPYCGFGEPTQLDHYLPKGRYGELAIYPRNLVPSCGPCNNAKRAIEPQAATGFIHPYFQSLPDQTFLQADVTFNAPALDVTFRVNPGTLNPSVASMLQFQLDRLKLNDRYGAQINVFLFQQKEAILTFKEEGSSLGGLEAYLVRSAASLKNVFGRNDWRTVLVEALSINAAFCAAPRDYFGKRAATPGGAQTAA